MILSSGRSSKSLSLWMVVEDISCTISYVDSSRTGISRPTTRKGSRVRQWKCRSSRRNWLVTWDWLWVFQWRTSNPGMTSLLLLQYQVDCVASDGNTVGPFAPTENSESLVLIIFPLWPARATRWSLPCYSGDVHRSWPLQYCEYSVSSRMLRWTRIACGSQLQHTSLGVERSIGNGLWSSNNRTPSFILTGGCSCLQRIRVNVGGDVYLPARFSLQPEPEMKDNGDMDTLLSDLPEDDSNEVRQQIPSFKCPTDWTDSSINSWRMSYKDKSQCIRTVTDDALFN